MKKVVVWLTAVAGVGVIALSMSTTACSGGGSCTYVSKCGADVPFTKDQITTCNNSLNDSCCGGDYADYLGCYQSNQLCLDSGPNVGSTDENGTNALCNDKLAKYQNCYFGLSAAEGGTCNH